MDLKGIFVADILALLFTLLMLIGSYTRRPDLFWPYLFYTVCMFVRALTEDNRAPWNKKTPHHEKRFFSYFSISYLALKSKNGKQNLFGTEFSR
jgi:hypothetical protein